MEIERIKEIKQALEENSDNGIMYEVNDQKHTCRFVKHSDILAYINELEASTVEHKCVSCGQPVAAPNKVCERCAEKLVRAVQNT